MKLASELTAGLRVPMAPSLEAVLIRIETLSLEPAFGAQRQLAVGRALRPYLEPGGAVLLAPLAEEVELANLYLYADFYPEDGQLTLIEQLRDVITEHVPEEERAWLDPLKHSYLDLLEIVLLEGKGITQVFCLRSLGDGRTSRLRGGDFSKGLAAGQVLLARLAPDPADPGHAVVVGSAIVLSAADGRTLYDATHAWCRQMELASGSFTLGEWQEFAKRYGHVLLWSFAQMRMVALVEAVVGIQYRTASGQPFLYALALYEHHEYKFLARRLSELEALESEVAGAGSGEPFVESGTVPVRTWVQRENRSAVVMRLTLTTAWLAVECESRDRLDVVKHLLAAEFGFSLHFRGESVTPPPRQVSESQLAKEEPLALVVTAEEEWALLNTFLENVYLEWADRESPALQGQTPRHAAVSPAGREKVAALIDEMERYDLGLRRIGRRSFDYNKLRAHVGLEEVSR